MDLWSLSGCQWIYGFFTKGLSSIPTKGISALLKLHNHTSEDVTTQCTEFRGEHWVFILMIIINVLLHFLMLGIGPAFCCTQWEIASKMGVILLWLPSFFPQYSTGPMHVHEFSAEEWFCYNWAAEPAPEIMEILFTCVIYLVKPHSHQWLRRYFYFCTFVLDLLNIFLPTTSHQKGICLYVCVKDIFA